MSIQAGPSRPYKQPNSCILLCAVFDYWNFGGWPYWRQRNFSLAINPVSSKHFTKPKEHPKESRLLKPDSLAQKHAGLRLRTLKPGRRTLMYHPYFLPDYHRKVTALLNENFKS